MDYEAIDKDMSSWVVTTTRLTVRFYLGEHGLGTDILSHATRYRYHDLADQAAKSANLEYAWKGFTWEPMSVPEALCVRTL